MKREGLVVGGGIAGGGEGFGRRRGRVVRGEAGEMG